MAAPELHVASLEIARLCLSLLYVRHTKLMLDNRAYKARLGQLQIELTSPIFVAGVGRSIVTPHLFTYNDQRLPVVKNDRPHCPRSPSVGI